MDDGDAWQQLAEQESYLWSSLQAIKQYISEETYRKAEQELGFAEKQH